MSQLVVRLCFADPGRRTKRDPRPPQRLHYIVSYWTIECTVMVMIVCLAFLYSGFFDCLGKHGEVCDDLKYGWLRGRQVRR